MKNGVLTNTKAVVTCRGSGLQSEVHSIDSGSLAWSDSGIVWVGPENLIPSRYDAFPRIDACKRIVIPGLVDCHTHLAFGGWRADEFRERARGASYLDIAKRGGGIMKTVRQTREASQAALLDHSRAYSRRMLELGVTTIECKSGYGLSLRDELKTLRVYESLRREGPVRIVSTCLAAHVVPADFRGRRDAYVDLVCNEVLPAVAEESLATFCDVFVEDGAFAHDEARRILDAGSRLGMRPKLHVDQLHDSGGARLAADVGAISADHLEYVSDDGIEAIAAAGVVPVALPIATLYLRQSPLDARRFLDRGVDVALATDFNPGSAPSFHLPLAMTLACTLNRMTPNEALTAVTRVAARALGVESTLGSLEVGKYADFVFLNSPSIDHWVYQFSPNSVEAAVIAGEVAFVAGPLEHSLGKIIGEQ